MAPVSIRVRGQVQGVGFAPSSGNWRAGWGCAAGLE